jgi:adenine specific DNA methylase Mod
MAGIKYKAVERSKKYKYTLKVMDEHGNYYWKSEGLGRGKLFDNERDCAKNIDLRLIEKGKEPVNILVRKK